jgi:hypothetical protein
VLQHTRKKITLTFTCILLFQISPSIQCLKKIKFGLSKFILATSQCTTYFSYYIKLKIEFMSMFVLLLLWSYVTGNRKSSKRRNKSRNFLFSQQIPNSAEFKMYTTFLFEFIIAVLSRTPMIYNPSIFYNGQADIFIK